MIKVTVIALSSLKEKYLKQACSEYEKRLSGYCKLEIIEIEPVKILQKPSQSEIDAALKKEAELINKKIPSGSFKAAACIEGRQFSSEKFSLLIKKAAMKKGSITFIIG
ncbi:MAG: 23S rRNA (pseudouridine(1915)-N(3))-methyltransferase RlmH, partial [Clostridia bacterium]|nr:23S rRNA (pseudouridine(1915)-N(3))-methyltransferase RlmH [Clostridia bacterium]